MATIDELRKFGYHDDTQNLPPLQFAPDEKDSIWWQATKEIATSIPQAAFRGTLDIITLPYKAGLIAGEVYTDRQIGPHGEELLPEPEDEYIGVRLGIPTAPVDRPDPNVYRMLRMTHAKTMEEIAPMPRPETLVGELASSLGHTLPQLALLGTGALAARGAKIAGKTMQALVMRTATMGTMFALEGTQAYESFMQYAEEKGLSPQQVSSTAFLGAIAYALSATALEYVGPFSALEKRMPGMKRRLSAAALMGATEFGTEILQAGMQEGLTYGLDFRDLTWENIQDSVRQVVMEGTVGAIAGGTIGGVAFRSQTTGDVDVDIDVDDPESLLAAAREIVAETDRQEHGVDRVEEAGPPPSEVPSAEAPSIEPTPPVAEPPAALKPTEIDETGIIPGETPEETEARVGRELVAQQIEKDAILGETDETLRTTQSSAPINVIEQNPEHPVRRLLSDETGAIDPDAFTEMLVRPLEAAGEMVGEGVDIAAAVSHLGFQTSRTLQGTPQGRNAQLFLDQVHHQGQFDTAQALSPWYNAWRSLPLLQRQATISWMRQYREDGQTNWSTLIEHPERMEGVTVPTGIQNLRNAYEFGFRYSGRNASEARVPQRIFTQNEKGEVTVQTRIFEPSADLKYQRRLTSEGRTIMRLQTGPGWDALLAWLENHPDRNPGLPTDSTALRETLRRITESAQTKKIGALEFVRVFKELPIALKIDGKWVDIQVRDPMSHHETNMFRESQRAAMWRVANELLWHYGDKYRIEKLNTMDLDKAIDRMRMEVSQAAGKKASRHAAVFDASLRSLEHAEQGSMMADLFGEVGKGTLVKTATLPIDIVWTAAIQLSPIYDLGNAMKAMGIVNVQGWFKGEASAIKEILKNPREFWAYYNSLGGFSDSYHDYTFHRDTMVDMVRKGITDIGGIAMRASERVSQFRMARIADLWVQGMNQQDKLSKADARMLRRYARLTEEQIGEIARGEMSERTKAIAIQAFVAQLAAFSEAPHRKGALQRNRHMRWLVRGTQVPAATIRQGLNLAGEIRDSFRSYQEAETGQERKDAIKEFGSAFLRMGELAVVVGGIIGFGTAALRRLLKRQPVFDPDDPESWYGWSALMLIEGGMFGPMGQILNAAKYSKPDLRTYTTNLIFPVAVGIDMVSFMHGVIWPENDWARDHPTTPFWERMRRDFLRYFPAIKAVDRWMTAMYIPKRDKFYRVRRWSQEWQKAQGIPYTGLARAEARRKRIYPYQIVWEAVRDGNPIALDEALNEYVEYARQQGWNLKDVWGRIDSSLAAKQPIPLKKAHQRKFLDSLSAERRAIVETEMARYKQTRREVKRRLGVLYGAE